MSTIRLEKVTKIYKQEERIQIVAKEIDLEIKQGEFVFVVGSSGAGKSTLLKLITGEIKPDQGIVYLDKINLAQISRRNQHLIHRTFGQVWQESRLIRKRTIAENLIMVAKSTLRGNESVEKHVSKVLGLVGMKGVEGKYPVELSSGECRKIELARALINSPHILVLDELTANLDEDSIWDVMYLLNELNRHGTTVIMATHAKKFVNIMRRRVITMVDGRILGDVQKGRYGDIV